MSKYIDADKARKGVMEFVNKYGEITGMFITDFNILLERSAADVAEVVRCGVCKHYADTDGVCRLLTNNYYPPVEMDEDDYCSKEVRNE